MLDSRFWLSTHMRVGTRTEQGGLSAVRTARIVRRDIRPKVNATVSALIVENSQRTSLVLKQQDGPDGYAQRGRNGGSHFDPSPCARGEKGEQHEDEANC
jgi:hypothetical protein